MPDSNPVDTHVHNTFDGTSYSTYTANGDTYYTFAIAPYERWVDTDSDGDFDYGLRPEGGGEWSTFRGYEWQDSRGNPMPDSNYDPPAGGGIARFAGDGDHNLTMPTVGTDDGWIF